MKEPSYRPTYLLWLWVALMVAAMLAGCGPSSATPTASGAAVADTAQESTPAVLPSPEPSLTAAALAPTSTPETKTQIVPTPSEETPAPTATPEPTIQATATQTETRPGAPPTSEPTTSGPTPTEPPPATAAAPQVLYFRATPTTTVNLGDSVALSWKAVGEKAELCPISGPGPVDLRCQEVPLVGSSEFVTDEEAMAYNGLGLHVTAGDKSIWSVVTLQLQCQNLRPWFFEDPPPRCPAELPQESYAAGQYFEGGFMIWVEDPDDFYVFYRGEDEDGFQTFDWILDVALKPGASEANRIGEEPPPGRYEPVSGFGLVWRGEIEGVRPDVRQRLGWATEPEFGFDTAYQCITPSHPRMWSCFLRGPRGEILYLHPDSTAQVRFLWEEQ